MVLIELGMAWQGRLLSESDANSREHCWRWSAAVRTCRYLVIGISYIHVFNWMDGGEPGRRGESGGEGRREERERG